MEQKRACPKSSEPQLGAVKQKLSWPVTEHCPYHAEHGNDNLNKILVILSDLQIMMEQQRVKLIWFFKFCTFTIFFLITWILLVYNYPSFLKKFILLKPFSKNEKVTFPSFMFDSNSFFLLSGCWSWLLQHPSLFFRVSLKADSCSKRPTSLEPSADHHLAN